MASTVALLAAVLASVPVGSARPLIVAVAPDLPGPADDGGIAVTADAVGLTVTDGARQIVVPQAPADALGRVWLVANATDWQAHGGWSPFVAVGQALRLGNEKGAVRLLAHDGSVMDAFAWGNRTVEGMEGSVRTTSPTLVYMRGHAGAGADGATNQQVRVAWIDTDRANDWQTPRMHRIGESALAPAAFAVDNLTIYASPDSSHAFLVETIRSAKHRLHVHVYEFTSLVLADAVAAALRTHPGLEVEVLVDGSPVGLEADDRARAAEALSRIQLAGGRVVLSGTGRYAHHHLKVLVADDTVAVQSENWVASGVPLDPSWGNRGWGVALHDREAADWFAAWMADDRAAWDTKGFVRSRFDPSGAPAFMVPARQGLYGPLREPLRVAGPVLVQAVVTPDTTADPELDPVAALLRAGHRIDAQQLDWRLQAKNALGWTAPDPWNDALRRAAAEGDPVRLVLAPPFAGEDPDEDPGREVRAAGGAVRTGSRPGIATWHNKGFIVHAAAPDPRWAATAADQVPPAAAAVVVGSINGNHASRSSNREVDVIVWSDEAARYFGDLFTSDWDASAHAAAGSSQVPPRDWGAPGRDLRDIPWAPFPTLLAVLGLGALVARRR